MKLVTVLAVTAMLAGALFSGYLISRSAAYVIGGEYKLEAGQSLKGDLYALFADVSVPAGAEVQGRIYSLCSDLKLAAVPEEPPVVWDLFGFTVRLPRVSYVFVSR